MKDSTIAGILLGAVAIFVLVATLLYLLIRYILWRIKPEAERQSHCLNWLFTCRLIKRKHKNDYLSNGEENGKNATVSFENKSFSNDEENVVIHTESVTLDVSPIRKSAETYSIVDLNDDPDVDLNDDPDVDLNDDPVVNVNDDPVVNLNEEAE